IFLPYLSVADKSKFSEVQSFYQDDVIFITGATGFLGKALLEKLLRSCPGISRIYILIRPKKDASPTGRLEVLLKSEVRTLHCGCSGVCDVAKSYIYMGGFISNRAGKKGRIFNFAEKHICYGVVSKNAVATNRKSVGFFVLDLQILKEAAAESSVFHIRRGSDAVVYVSTAYVNCDHETLEERLYPSMVKPDDIITLTKTMDEVDLVKLTPELLGTKPNTYIFTKHLAESIVAEHGQRIPLVIVRPSIVSASWREPVAGWLDGLQGVNLLVASAVTGVLTTIVADKSAVMDIIPIDVVANALIVAACQAPLRGRTLQVPSRQNLPVYNCTSGAINKISYGEVAVLTTKLGRKHTPATYFGRPGIDITMSPFYQAVAFFLFNYLPALLSDLIAIPCFDDFRFLMVDIQKKYQYFFFTTRFVTTHNWKFNSEKFIELHAHNTPLDRKIFNMDIRCINWEIYWEDYVKGMRRYLDKQQTTTSSDSPIQKGR
ncbi:unnamed protein product, partial [Ixodes persulcatus]